jgi:2-amino-4-hydroxy-6-hydroxymethyldihydropteridine diphosphokinase
MPTWPPTFAPVSFALIALGSNQGQPLKQLAEAQRHIARRMGRIVKASSVYQTAAWGLEDQPDFLNQVLLIETPYPPLFVLKTSLEIERQMGRRRIQKWGPRSIDLDLILFDQVVLNHPDLILPHPHMAERAFVLKPASEVAPNWRHPITQKSLRDLLKQCPDPLSVRKLAL